ncbi:hypothetical protein T492DRAFT_861730 [Pavlovales sp. CCMP2436]|nr:hypothetical protein T492DRAFT_861730 [Pavlovales sp. CCMP2436]
MAQQAFERSDAAGGCTIKLDKEPVIEYLTSNVTMLKWMIAEGSASCAQRTAI